MAELGTDLQLARTPGAGASVDGLVVGRGDLQLLSGRGNMAQSIVNRLLTRQGELADLGHPRYGSRLHQLIGEPNNRRTRILADYYIRECLADEPRISEIVAIVVAPPSPLVSRRNLLEAEVQVRLVGDDQPLRVSVALELG